MTQEHESIRRKLREAAERLLADTDLLCGLVRHATPNAAYPADLDAWIGNFGMIRLLIGSAMQMAVHVQVAAEELDRYFYAKTEGREGGPVTAGTGESGGEMNRLL